MKNLNWQLATHDEDLAQVQTAVDTASAVGNQNAATTKPMFLFSLPVPSVKKVLKKCKPFALDFSFRLCHLSVSTGKPLGNHRPIERMRRQTNVCVPSQPWDWRPVKQIHFLIEAGHQCSGHHGKCMDGAFEIQLCCCSSFFNRSFPPRTFGSTSK